MTAEDAPAASSSVVEDGLLHVGKDVVLGELPSFSDEELLEKKGYWKKHLKGVRKVVAPMVDQSELAFRMMMRQHGADLCFSPMVHAHLFVSDMTYRKTALSSCSSDRPLIVQFCANDVETFLTACRLVEGFCDGVDLNLGCPQIIAKRGRYGAYLQEDRELIRSMVEAVYKHCRLPLSVKIRRLDTMEETIEYAKMIEGAGASLLTLHGRTRDMRGVNTGLADWSYIKSIKDVIEIPLIANGNIQMEGDVQKCLEETGADAVMSAEGILNNPFLFEDRHDECWVVAREYLDYAEKYDANTSAIRAHIFRICHHSLLEYTDLRERVSYVASVGEYRAIINELEARVKGIENYEPIIWGTCYPTVSGADLVEKIRACPHWMCKPYFRPSKDDSQPSDSVYREKRREEIDRMVEETGLSRRQLRKRERRRIAGQKIISHAQKKVYEKCVRCNQPAGQGLHRFKFSDRAADAVLVRSVAEEKEEAEEPQLRNEERNSADSEFIREHFMDQFTGLTVYGRLSSTSSTAMQLLSTQRAWYVKSAASLLRCDKKTKRLTVEHLGRLAEEADVHIVAGAVETVLGKLELDGQQTFLLVVSRASPVADYRNGTKILHVDRVNAVPIEDNGRVEDFTLDGAACGNLEKLKNQQKKLMKFVTNKITYPRKIDEVLRLFNDGGDFYYASEGEDITLCLQKYHESRDATVSASDDRFFWNKHLLEDLYTEDGKLVSDAAKQWITPVLQGHVAQRSIFYEVDVNLVLTLISRRSKNRAGVRYLRRGVDADSNVANFVETETIMRIFGHQLSFIQIRGSVPVFWSQRGYKYRPPLVIDKPMNDSLPVFKTHFEQLISYYKAPISVINLVDQTGRELGLARSFLEHTLEADMPELAYFSFDFHHHCRALRFQKVNELMNALDDQFNRIGFCWIDKSDQMVLMQKGIIRTNCVDCLDRTNVVQSAISQSICMRQARKLGLMGPQNEDPEVLVKTLQYAGTDALKGDITRSGQRKLVGIMRDGYNSASRYYLSHMRDAQRQIAIDSLLSGRSDVKEEADEEEEDIEEESANIGRLVHETVHFVLPENEVLVGGWALVDGTNQSDQIDTVLLLTGTHLYIALYDDSSEKLVDLKIIEFAQLKGVHLGLLPGKNQKRIHLQIRWAPHVSNNNISSAQWRAARTRLFNNVAISLKNGEEADEYVQSISEQIRVTVLMSGRELNVDHVARLDTGAAPRSIASKMTSVLRLRPSSASPAPSVNDVQKNFRDDMAANNNRSSNLLDAPSLTPSRSDGILSERGSTLAAKLQQKIRNPTASAPPVDPFQSYADRIRSSKSLIMML
ncbi:hypothetical protein QR680_008299 [Steinernema hermaphroditum]|uniref:SAC domain-containing protein n=1 Tax=Steinernema hermaphroditum TaxID=289476 RepID=A0AA39IG41_9BILA|nr:hypothetical protein QR680_008299 [Steinernema hermaphroditum]